MPADNKFRGGEVVDVEDFSEDEQLLGSDGVPKDTEEQQREELTNELRTNVAKAVAFVKGQETVESFAAFTFEEALDRQIERIEGGGSETRPNKLDRIRKIRDNMVSITEQLKSTEDRFFRPHDADTDVNT